MTYYLAMLTRKAFLVVFILCILQVTTNAQSNKAAFDPIFEDLPIDDPAKNSKIKSNETAEEKIRKNIFVTATLTKSKCYLGEPILLTYKLYSCLESSSTIQKRPSLLGFIAHEIAPDNAIPEYKKIDGKNYRTFTIQQLQLISVKEGEAMIDPIVVDNSIRYKKDNGQTDKYSGPVSGEKLSLTVAPLPSKGRPNAFSGAVGDFTVSAAVKSVSFASNENNVLEIAIHGTGNFNNFSVPEINWPAGVEPYAASERSDIKQTIFPPKGSKFFLIPFTAKVGTYTIPPVAISFFDPAKKSYTTVQSNAIQVKALPPIQMPAVVTGKVENKQKQIEAYYWWISVAALLVLTGLIILLRRKTRGRKENLAPALEPVPIVPQEEPIDFKKELESIAIISDSKEYLLSFKSILIQYLRNILGNEESMEAQLLLELKTLDGEIGELAETLCDQCNFHLYTSESLDGTTRSLLEERFVALIDKANNIGS